MTSRLLQKASTISKRTFISLFCIVTFISAPLYIAFNKVKISKTIDVPNTTVESIILPLGENLSEQFAAYGYDLDDIRKGYTQVPNIYLEELPRELKTIKDTDLKKQLFISVLLPPILKVNEYIVFERRQLSEIISRIEINGDYTPNDLRWLDQKMSRYKLKEFNVAELYSRMNIIPPSLALTQAAIETGWGSSRFAQEANALFGQWTYEEDEGIVPLAREEGKTHRVKKFNNLLGAVESYALNLNTHAAYEEFRLERRKYARPEDIEVSSLLITLIFYSELGYEYIDNLNSIIRLNELANFDKATLQKRQLQAVISTQAP
ncbi:MAG: hypothetical protein HOH19_11885 [Kordiimonadaceae bacterium]|jgi:Bax protein|nr:hypothetical protein [Kordiimonadaceae bacterium]MBT6033270.1 hypothetical protein [Kordiimonadaceae bacterium]